MRGRGQRQRSPEADAAFRRAMDDAKDRKNLSDVIGRHTKLRRAGRELKGLCPFHDERSPSFEVNDAKGVFYCHGCGACGDHFTILTKLDGLSFRDAYAALAGDNFPTVDPADRAKAIEEDAHARAAAVADARYMWSRCVPPAGTPAERYLRGTRGIVMPLPPSVRFGVVPTKREDDGSWGRPYPAVVLAATDLDGEIVGLQRIFLLNDGSDKRWGKRSKLSLGRPRGSPVRMSGAGSTPGEVIVTEGPEDALTLAQELRGREVWATLGTAMMVEAEYPLRVRSVVIAGQNDKAGRAAALKAGEGLTRRSLGVSFMWPKEGFKDWNDQLRGVRA